MRDASYAEEEDCLKHKIVGESFGSVKQEVAHLSYDAQEVLQEVYVAHVTDTMLERDKLLIR